MRLLILIMPLVLAVAGCAPLSQEEMAEREYRHEDFRARFIDYKERCEALGGNVVIRSHRKIRADRIARPGDRYHCELP